MFSESDDCSIPLQTLRYVEGNSLPEKRYLRSGNYQIKMYQPNYVEDSIVAFSTIAESFQTDHIPAYSTLISVNKVDLKKLERDRDWVP